MNRTSALLFCFWVIICVDVTYTADKHTPYTSIAMVAGYAAVIMLVWWKNVAWSFKKLRETETKLCEKNATRVENEQNLNALQCLVEALFSLLQTTKDNETREEKIQETLYALAFAAHEMHSVARSMETHGDAERATAAKKLRDTCVLETITLALASTQLPCLADFIELQDYRACFRDMTNVLMERGVLSPYKDDKKKHDHDRFLTAVTGNHFTIMPGNKFAKKMMPKSSPNDQTQ